MMLFSDVNERRSKVSEAVDQLKDRFGENVVTRGSLMKPLSQQ